MMVGYTSGADDTFDHAWVVPETNIFTFKIKCCEHARIALSTRPYVANQETYELNIGMSGNTESMIR